MTTLEIKSSHHVSRLLVMCVTHGTDLPVIHVRNLQRPSKVRLFSLV